MPVFQYLSTITWPAPARRELHLVMDTYAAHKRVEIRTWLAANPRIHVHFTPTCGSWLNLVEVWFGIIERQAIRGTFRSVPTSSLAQVEENCWIPSRLRPYFSAIS
jgi:transposase